MNKKQQGFGHIELVVILVVVSVVGFAGYRVFNNVRSQSGSSTSKILQSNETSENKAVAAGKNLSGGKCSGTEKLTFTNLPMKKEDFSLLIPYGLVIGGHVTPIDHQYFAPADQNSARDSYPVYAMADASITDIQPRTTDRGTEYRLVFTHSCTSLYYYDLVTSLTGKVKDAYDKHGDINVPVKAGEQIGAIGGQTLDFALWDTDKPLTGFINAASYDAEPWKIYTTDPYPSYTPELKALLIERNLRTAKPIAGKIDYDIDGKLIGNWFEKGSGGYRGSSNNAQDYWKSHLSIAPNLYDPKHFIISIGDFGGEAMQFAAKGNTPDPATVGVDTGTVKYDLQRYNYLKTDGSYWNNMSVAKDLTVGNSGGVEGCLVVKLTDPGTLKAESFPKKSCSVVSGFTGFAKIFVR